MGEQERFEGLEVAEIEFELGGGGTARETDVYVGNGDIVEGTWRGKVVNVKHPFKSDQVVRMQTVNIETAEIKRVVEKYVAPEKAEQPELANA